MGWERREMYAIESVFLTGITDSPIDDVLGCPNPWLFCLKRTKESCGHLAKRGLDS